ncbi:hypothetical protein [Azovibrio restrictus]|uniref:hypothetical protein n=1 Tax=Azovibrio restrictus TaxID=146938 RepID=UPI0026EA7C30|nr:hypothetical protein [Azovibrio restrictus]
MPSPNLPAEPASALEALRARYQKGLLAWLKAPDSGAGLLTMCEALAECASLDPCPHWPAAQNLLAAIQRGELPPRVEYRRLAGRVDQALRRAARQESGNDPALLQELQASLAQLAPPPQPPMAALVPRGPLASTLEATAAILPLLAREQEPRFKAAQRRGWDQAVTLLAGAWEQRLAGWQPLRRAVFPLLEGALALQHPAPLRLAEALASATDLLETSPPGPRLLAALCATLELLQEPDFLEHEALEERVAQLVSRLEAGDRDGSPALEALFVQEAQEVLEHLHLALEAVPPDSATLAAAAAQLRELAEHAERPECSRWAARLEQAFLHLPPEQLDLGPARHHVQTCLASLEAWLHGGSADARATAGATLEATLTSLDSR